MSLGFGALEIEVEQAVLERLARGDSAEIVERELQEAADRYGKLPQDEAPERYSRVWIQSAYPDGCRRLRFQHINRRHALSPDGWAGMMRTVFYDPEDYDHIERQCPNCGEGCKPSELVEDPGVNWCDRCRDLAATAIRDALYESHGPDEAVPA